VCAAVVKQEIARRKLTVSLRLVFAFSEGAKKRLAPGGPANPPSPQRGLGWCRREGYLNLLAAYPPSAALAALRSARGLTTKKTQ
jgi:hypothetical protein